MLDESALRQLIGRDVVDRDGRSVGYLELIFNDRDTGKPEWVGVMTGKLRHHHVLVPVSGVERDKDRLRVRWTKDLVTTAPDFSKSERSISDEMEREAYRHYGLEPEPAGSGTA